MKAEPKMKQPSPRGVKALSEYRAACERIVSSANPSVEELAKFVDWITGDGSDVLKNVFVQEFRVKLGALSDPGILEAGIPSTNGETVSKLESVAFYQANYAMLKALFDEIAVNKPRVETPAATGSDQMGVTYALTRAAILDSLTLIGDYAEFRLEVSGFSVRAAGTVNSMDLVRAAATSSLGAATLDSHAGIPLFRCALEMRIRRALGLVAKIRKTDGSPLPVNLSDLLDAVEPDESDFKTNVPLHHLRRANSWANLYVHMALRCYAWQPRFVVRYFSPFLLGESGKVKTKAGQTQSIHSGIQTTEIVLARIRRRLDKSCRQNEKLLWSAPEQCDLVLTG